MREVIQCIGKLPDDLSEMLCLEGGCMEIFIDERAIRHIKKRHPYTYKTYFDKLSEILSAPDYIGIQGLVANRFELVKQYKDTLLVALKIDEMFRIFVSSMYIIESHRIEKRIAYGKLKVVDRSKTEYKRKKEKKKGKSGNIIR